MVNLKHFPVTNELLTKCYDNHKHLITRASKALDWAPETEHLFDMAGDKVIACALFLIERADLYNIRNLGKSCVEPLYEYTHSEEGQRYFISSGLDNEELREVATHLINNEIKDVRPNLYW